MRGEESRIVWEGAHVYVYRSRFRMRGYEIRINAGTHAIIAGWQSDEAIAIRCAKRLDANGWQHVLRSVR